MLKSVPEDPEPCLKLVHMPKPLSSDRSQMLHLQFQIASLDGKGHFNPNTLPTPLLPPSKKSQLMKMDSHPHLNLPMEQILAFLYFCQL